MATKKSSKKTPKSSPKLPLVKNPNYEHIQVLIQLTERAITGQASGVDEFFGQQLSRLKKQLAELK